MYKFLLTTVKYAARRGQSVLWLGCGLDDRGSILGGGGKHFSPLPRPNRLGLDRPPICREADHSHLSSDKVKNTWSYTSTPPYVIAWCLIKYRKRFHDVVLS
jgi:hypothetical protein